MEQRDGTGEMEQERLNRRDRACQTEQERWNKRDGKGERVGETNDLQRRVKRIRGKHPCTKRVDCSQQGK
jgi:hypothetical protein